MKKNIITVIVVFFLVAMLVNIVNMNNAELFSESNTTELSATVTHIEKIDSLYERTFIIHTKEYGDKIRFHTDLITGVSKDISNIDKNVLIYFRVENIWLDDVVSLPFFEIVSLRTEDKNIISIDEQNGVVLSRKKQATDLFIFMVAGICVVSGFVLVVKKCKKTNTD